MSKKKTKYEKIKLCTYSHLPRDQLNIVLGGLGLSPVIPEMGTKLVTYLERPTE